MMNRKTGVIVMILILVQLFVMGCSNTNSKLDAVDVKTIKNIESLILKQNIG
ncbi:MAG: hypothetical protein ACOYJC_06385 [Christensenellales bacterium]|jgi:hypothetical protein